MDLETMRRWLVQMAPLATAAALLILIITIAAIQIYYRFFA